ncbi:MAG: tRNA (N6-isopentenyl adenosine(37)-C2)-methylthiotransferase MiaB, partial [Bacilli bacterium]|nr:tRNA (N6-isopentenyl adenosine(37)-C2)-methylthiotransferase MiaB [Bacilli bacterium]
MKLPNLNEARKRTNNEVDYIYLNQNYDGNMFRGQKYFLRTYGCQMNVHDGEEIAARLESLGLTNTETIENADVVILNTCAIRENAHDKLYGFLGRCKHEKEKNNHNLIIGICGCMAQEEGVVEDIIKKHPYVDIVFGTHNIHELQDLLIKRNDKQNIEVYSCEGNVYENISYKRDSNIKAWVNIQYGCDKFCTYCIVPYTRGKQRSRKSREIIKEVEELVKNGYKEVTLLGQNVNAYGKELESEISFAELLREVSKTGIDRIRFVTSHPWDFTDDMIKAIAECDNIMPYIHLPLQSGSSRILKLMGRRYTKEEYLE